MLPLPEAIILVLAPFAPLFSQRVWLHAQRLLLGAMLAPGARTVTAALRVMGLATERGFTHDHRVLNRATWLARQGRRMLLEWLMTWLVPAGATIVLGADESRGTPQWRQDHGERLRSRCGALDHAACHPLLRPDMGVDDAPGPGALGKAGVGIDAVCEALHLLYHMPGSEGA